MGFLNTTALSFTWSSGAARTLPSCSFGRVEWFKRVPWVVKPGACSGVTPSTGRVLVKGYPVYGFALYGDVYRGGFANALDGGDNAFTLSDIHAKAMSCNIRKSWQLRRAIGPGDTEMQYAWNHKPKIEVVASGLVQDGGPDYDIDSTTLTMKLDEVGTITATAKISELGGLADLEEFSTPTLTLRAELVDVTHTAATNDYLFDHVAIDPPTATVDVEFTDGDTLSHRCLIYSYECAWQQSNEAATIPVIYQCLFDGGTD